MSYEEVSRNLHNWEERAKDAMLELAEKNAKEAENYARGHRPWTDVTSQAEKGLTGSAEKMSDGVRFVLAHTVQHGVYLELAHGRKYKIIEEAMRQQGLQALRDLKALLT